MRPRRNGDGVRSGRGTGSSSSLNGGPTWPQSAKMHAGRSEIVRATFLKLEQVDVGNRGGMRSALAAGCTDRGPKTPKSGTKALRTVETTASKH